MNQKYIETIRLSPTYCDMYYMWKPSAILETMQETAGWHSTSLGLDPGTMDSWGIAWVVTRLKVEFSRVPVSGETVTVETWPLPSRHMFFPRSHVFTDAQGNEVGRAHSLWAIIDLSTRRIIKSEQVVAHMPDTADLQPALGMPATVRALPGDPVIGTVQPRFTDLDANVHVNNTKYLDWCANALDMEIMREKYITAFDVNYDAEICYGTTIRTELNVEGDAFSFLGFSDEKRHFGVSGKLVSRK